jgi:hypothetical protein
MYLQLAEEEDKKVTENWKGDADGILIFVSRHCMSSSASIHTDRESEDWPILCRCCDLGCGVRAGPQPKFPGHFSILPRKDLSDPRRRFEWPPGPYSSHAFRSVHTIHPTNLYRLGQLALVPQPCHQSHVCTFGDITPAMGASLHETHPDTIQSTQASANSRVLC